MSTSHSHAAPAAGAQRYFIPAPSRFPVTTACGLLLMILGGSQWVNDRDWGAWVFLAGVIVWLVTLAQWFVKAIGESESGQYSKQVDVSFRWSMAWFIFSEVMFFGSFFGALFWARAVAMPMLGNLDHQLLWPDFHAIWPSTQPGITGSPADTIAPFQTMSPWPIPTLNTAILLSSGVTLTIAHHALLAERRTRALVWMWITVLLGASFISFQAFEYHHAYTEMNLKLSSGAYGSTFFMLTGFHGFHVFVGMTMLFFITLRIHKGHFTPQRHFGFEGAAWYWHFVDVVWLGLYAVVYWL
jgi:cytochrome c oxidase subunit 3